MAWTDTLLDASFRGVPFDCETVGRGGQRAIAAHSFPYVDGSELEDMGLVGGGIRLRAVFWGDDYEAALKQFISALAAPGSAELVHPIHGSITAMASTWEDEHQADLVDGAIVSVVFLEDGASTNVFEVQSAATKVDAITASADAARELSDDALDRYVSSTAFEMPRITVLKDTFNQAKSVLRRILSVTGYAKLLLSDLDPLIYPRAYAADLLSMVDRAFQGLPFGGRNSTYDGAVAAVTAVAVLSDFGVVRDQLQPADAALSPAAVAPSAAMLADIAVVQAHLQVLCATAIAEAAAIVLAGEADAPLLQRADIEQLTGQTRSAIQVAIDSTRSALDAEGRGQVTAALTTMAYQVQEAARAVINLRPPLIQRASPIAGPVRLVAHVLYGSPDRADELRALNQFGREVLIAKGQVLYAYAS